MIGRCRTDVNKDLAEISRLNLRTIQRVENGEPSNGDTRRALALAFDLDADMFTKTWNLPSQEEMKAEIDRVKRGQPRTELVPVPLKKIVVSYRNVKQVAGLYAGRIMVVVFCTSRGDLHILRGVLRCRAQSVRTDRGGWSCIHPGTREPRLELLVRG